MILRKHLSDAQVMSSTVLLPSGRRVVDLEDKYLGRPDVGAVQTL